MSDEDGDDPFENLDPPEDREGDPFERLGDIDGPDTDETVAESGEETEPPDSSTDESFEAEHADGSLAGPGEPPTGDGATDDGDPFTGMDGRDGDPFDGETLFESVDIDEVDVEEVWAELNEESDTTPSETNRYTDVSKHRFCEQCEFFAEPPAAHCTHEEAEIVEYLDMETVRLLNCPIVAEQRQLEADE